MDIALKQASDKNKRTVSMKVKVFGFLVIFTAIILIILWLTQTVFLSDIYKTIKMSDLYKSADEITNNISNGKTQAVADRLSQKNELCILVEDGTGKTIVSAKGLNSCIIHNLSYRDKARLYLEAKSQGKPLISGFDVDTDTKMLTYTKCVTDKDGNDFVIFINSLLTPVDSTVKTLNTMLGYISITLLLIALVMSFVISHTITKPLKKLTKSANELATGNYDADFSDNSSKEIAVLADTLNYASSELKKNGALKRELVANISHDLRTPLTLITGYGEVMRDIPNEMTSENVQIIIDESKRLSSLVNDVLDISKYQAGTITINIEQFDITEVVRETFTRYQKLVDQDGYDIQVVTGEPCNIFADRQKILQVLYNLVNNAVTHTGDNKKVVITQSVVSHDGHDFVRIDVTDFGEGIPADKLPLIWDRYYKVDKYHKRAEMGSGLGLSIVKSIIEIHNGYYGVISTIGVGSTFWFELPIDS